MTGRPTLSVLRLAGVPGRPRSRPGRFGTFNMDKAMNQPGLEMIDVAEEVMEEDLELTSLDQVHLLQRLIGPVLATKILLEVAVSSPDAEQRRLAAGKLLSEFNEDPEEIADQLRSSIFKDVSIEELEAIVKTGATDPERALELLGEANRDSE